MPNQDHGLPAELLQRLEAILFRGGEALARDEAFERLAVEHAAHAAAIHAWVRQVLGLGDGSLREPPPELPGYRAIEKLGEGGFGEVWRCEQSEPVKREVAVKLLKLGMDSAAILKRFAREQEAMARMSHDAIARIHDAGLSPKGQPFFVMELVDGAPITDWCEQRRLGLKERLELFVEVCGGVQHAHQKGLVHRDLKPSNVLVTQVGAEAQPKLIDFGIARALEANDGSLQLTESGMMLGTPAYMAPEQARGDLLAIDTRTDVYALGAILFELLTGKQPHGDWLAAQASPWELRQRIVEGNTPRPSATVIGAGKQETTWQRQLRGDLDWIVLKAMAKEPEQRYASAAELAADVGRYLRLEPVLAGPPSRSYQLKKFLRRYRLQVGAAVAVLVTAVAGALVSWRWAREAEANAGLATQRANENAALAAEKQSLASAESAARQQAQDAAAAAEARSRELTKVVEFQEEQLGGIDVPALGEWLRQKLVAGVAAGQRGAVEKALAGLDFTDLALAELEDNLFASSLRSIEQQFADQPELQARLLQVVAETLRRLGALEMAEAPQREVLRLSEQVRGAEHPRTIASIVHLSILLEGLGKYDEAEKLANEAHDRSRLAFGDRHQETLAALNNVAFVTQARGRAIEAEERYRQAATLAREILEPGDPGRWATINNHAGCLLGLDRLDEAEALLDEVGLGLAGLADEPDVAAVVRDRSIMVGRLLAMRGKWEEAESRLAEALAAAREQLGARHRTTLRAMAGLALVLEQRRAFPEAEALLREALDASKLRFGSMHEETLATELALASVLASTGRLTEAEPLLRRVLEGRTKLFGRMHEGTLSTLNNLAANVLYQGRSDEAGELFAQALQLAKELLGDEHRKTLATWHNVAFLLWRTNRHEDARRQLDDLVPKLERKLGVEHRQTLQCRELLAAVFESLGDRERAAGQRAADLPLMRAAFGDLDPETQTCENNLSELLVSLRRFDEAVELLESVIARRRAAGGPDGPTMQLMNDLMQAQIARQQFDAAVTVGGEVVALAVRAFGEDHGNTRLLRGNLAMACERGGRAEQAEQLLRQNLTGADRVGAQEPQAAVQAGFALGSFLQRVGRYADAETELMAARQAAIERLGDGHPLVRAGAGLLAELFAAWNRAEPAASKEAAAHEWRQRAGT